MCRRRVLSLTNRSLFSSLVESPSLLQPSYIIHPTTKLRNAESQGFGLTGCTEGKLPPGFVEFAENLDIAPWKRLMEKAVIFEKEFEARAVDTIHHNSDYLSVAHNLLKVVFSQASSHEGLRDLHVSGDCHVNGSWYRMDRRIDVRGRPGILVKSKNPLKTFFTGSDLSQEAADVSDDSEDIFTGLNVWNVRSDEEAPVIKISNQFPYYHTLLMFSRKQASYDSDIQNLLLYLHGLAMSQALSRGKVAGQFLEPECLQGMVTDGQRFSFVWYQLNSCGDDLERRNVAAIVRSQKLFSGIAQTTLRKDHSSRKLSDYNDSVLKNFVSLFLWQS